VDETGIRRALDVDWQGLGLGHETIEAEGARFVKNLALPQIYDANFVYHITAATADEIHRLIARVEREYTHAKRITFRVGPWTPPAFEAQLALDGYERREALGC
jgi:hypothetical protein